MNKYACMTLAVAAMIASSATWAEMPAGGQQGAMDPQAAEARKGEEALMFKNRKEEMLLRITDRMAEMQRKKDCLQAANDKEALLKCMPQGGPGGMQGGEGDHHMMMGGPAGQHGGHMMMDGSGGQQPPGTPGNDPHGH